MSPQLRSAFEKELALAGSQLLPAAWQALERAHILSQAYAVAHTRVHWRMFVFAVRTRNIGEAVGQMARLVLAAPGSLLGRAPIGNTGGANVGIFSPMAIPEDLRALLLTDARSKAFLGKM